MDDLNETETLTAGERLRAAREEKGLSLDDIAAQTRIPRRHLESLEMSEWSRLPAQTYTIGFARSYAGVVGVDRAEIADQLRAEMGGQGPATSTAEVFEPADPARSMPKWLVLAAIAAVLLLVLLMSYMRNRSLEEPDQPTVAAAGETPAAAPPPVAVPAPAAAAQGPVVLTATGPAWIQVTDQGKSLFAGELAPGQSFTVPATATAPTLKAGKPEALRINVGSAVAPPVGAPGKVASNVSLLPADLMRGGAAAAAGGQPPAPAPAG
jgi:cytoskeletal protein RodZ